MIAVIAVMIIVAGVVGWRLGHSGNSSNNSPSVPKNSNQTSKPTKNTAVDSLISYNLPDGWSTNTCGSATDKVFVVPNGTTLNCNANPSAPIKLYIDPQDTTDCQQLGNIQGVKKHVCISLYINGHRSLKASTTYPKSSTYATETTISDYYIDTGKGVAVAEYTYTSNNDFQIGFDQLANGIKIK